MSKELVTPQQAALWLSKNPKNRRIRPHYVDRLATMMSKGLFGYNGESVKINEDGDLVDGQHRLSAVVKCGIPQMMEVVRDLPLDAPPGDVGEKRTVADHLHMTGWGNPHTLASAARVLNAFEKGVLARINAEGRFYPWDADQVLQRHPQLAKSVDVACTIQNDMKRVYPRHGEIGFFHYIFTRVDPIKGDEFIRNLAQGAGLASNSPILHLRNLLIDDAAARKKLPDSDKRAAIIKAWNAHIRTQTMKRLRVTEAEDFPRVTGLRYDVTGKPVL